MAVNLSKNGPALMAAYEEVVDGNSNTNWALFTYEGNSNDIRLAGKGDGGLEEVVEELNSGKVMYAFCRVQDPNSGLPKYVLINWTGEGVKDSRKGICANHLGSMGNFLKGAHVTINARGEEDVEPETILAKVAKASGANFNFHKQTEYRDAPRGPVGSVYRKVNAVEEIQQTKKEEFWVQAERDEELRQQEESKRAELERQKLEKERKEMEEKQAKERERKAKERAQQIQQEKIYQKKREEEEERAKEQQRLRDEELRRQEESKRAELERQKMERQKLERQKLEREQREMEEKQVKEKERKAKEQAQQIQQEKIYQKQREEEEERAKKQQQLNQQDKEIMKKSINSAASVQKANEAKALISQRSFNPRDIFKQREQSFEADIPSPTASRPAKLQSPFLSQKSFERESQVQPEDPAPAAPTSWRSHLSSTSPVSPVLSHSPAAAVSHTSPEKAHSPVQPADAAHTEEEEWSDEFDDDDADEAAPEEYPAEDDLYNASKSDRRDEDLYENVYRAEDANGENICAKALYDYQAADDTEITFDPDDVITGIDMVDEGWWRGFAPDGHYGLFPANYVELL